MENPSRKISPNEIASYGMIATLMTSSSSWLGGYLSIPQESLGTERKQGIFSLLPKPYMDKVILILHQRKRIFSEWTISTVFGRYMTIKAVEKWSVLESPLVVALNSVYADMIIDRDYIVENSKAVGREYSKHEWNRVNPGTGNPPLVFSSDTENAFSSRVPSVKELSSSMFWTDYHLPPSAGYQSRIVEEAYRGNLDKLSRTFANQVIAGLKDSIIRTCDHVDNLTTKNKNIDHRLADTLPNKMAIIKAMYFINDDETISLINNLQSIAAKCYDDPVRTIKLTSELREKALETLDEISVE